MDDKKRRAAGAFLAGLAGDGQTGDEWTQHINDAPDEVKHVVGQLIHILDEAASRPPHECSEGCHCRQAYRRALAQAMGEWET